MKRTAKRNGTVAAMTWDLVWKAFGEASRGGDAEAISEAKAAVRRWHEQHGAPIPGWAW